VVPTDFFLELNLQVKIGQNQSSSVKASQHNAAFEVSRTIIGHVTSWKKKSSIKIKSQIPKKISIRMSVYVLFDVSV
jgi:hypothetical protein